MAKHISIRVIIALFTVAICTVCLTVFWLVIFSAASSLARDQAHEVRVAHLQLVQAAVTQYFATPPAVATLVRSQIHRRFKSVSYAEIYPTTTSLLSAVLAHNLTAGGIAVRVAPRTLAYGVNTTPPCNVDLAVISAVGSSTANSGYLYANATQAAPRIAIVAGKNTNYTSPMQVLRVSSAVNGTCAEYSWSILCTRFRRDLNRTNWGSLNTWGNVHISFNVPLASFVSEFTNADGTQTGFVWVDVSVEATKLVPFLSKLDLADGEVLFLVDRDFTLVAASSGPVFRNASVAAWQRADSLFVHPWIQRVGSQLINSGLPLQSIAADLKLGDLVASTLLVDDGRDLVLLVVSVAQERTLLRRLRDAQKLTLWLGGALLGISILLAALLSWLVTRPLGRLVSVLGLVADMRLDDIPPGAEKRESHLLEVRLLQTVLFSAVARLKEYKLYMPTTLFTSVSEKEVEQSEDAAERCGSGLTARDERFSSHNESQQQPTVHSSQQGATRVHGAHLCLGLSARNGTVLLCDVSGFHELPSAVALQEIVALHGRYISAVFPAIKEARGVADGFVGDHIVASWNTQQPLATHRSAACACALEIQKRLRDSACSPSVGSAYRSAFPLAVRVSLAAGRVYFGNLGSAERRAFSIIGPAVVTATAIGRSMKDPSVAAALSTSTGSGRNIVQADTRGGCIIGIGGSVALEQKAYYHFSPAALCTVGVPSCTVMYSIHGAANTGGHNSEWMYELQQVEQGNKPEVWALMQYVEGCNHAAAARTLTQASSYMSSDLCAQVERFLAQSSAREILTSRNNPTV